MEKRKRKGSVISTVSTIIVIIVVLLAVLLVGGRILGLKLYTVLSPSMEPTYRVGSVIYVKPVDPLTIEEGQAITFHLDGNTVATHRVIEVVRDNDTVKFRTKGDANTSPDGTPVDFASVIGVPVFNVPYLGYVVNYIQHPPGLYVAAAVVVILLLLTILPDKSGVSSKGKIEKGGSGDNKV